MSAGVYLSPAPETPSFGLQAQFKVGAPRAALDVAEHHPSHRNHLRKLATDPSHRRGAPLLDAIIMPTNRRLDEVRSGVQLQATLARHLDRDGRRPVVVLLCSGAARSKHLPRKLFAGTRVLAIDVPAGFQPSWPRLQSESHSLSTHRKNNDVGLKRNLGLVLARMNGWKNVLLLDDDVSRLRTPVGAATAHFGLANIADALIALGERESRAVGWVLDDFPDNSVVCHARGLVGLVQDKFIGGGALLVRCDGPLPFFPATYNEDWLFLLPFMLAEENHGRSLIEGGLVAQDPYPVYVPKRAISEEFGDTLGEGLFNLLAIPRKDFLEASRSYEYWENAVAGRISMIDTVITRLEVMIERATGDTDKARAALEAVGAARKVHDETRWSSALATYCRRWQHDLHVWSEWLPSVERGLPLKHLGLKDNATWWDGAEEG